MSVIPKTNLTPEENGEVKMTKSEIITMIENAGFEAVERDTVYNRVQNAVAN